MLIKTGEVYFRDECEVRCKAQSWLDEQTGEVTTTTEAAAEEE